MKILVIGNESSLNELTADSKNIQWLSVDNISSFFESKDADAFFNLTTDAHLHDYSKINKPVFINSVSKTLAEMNASKNIIRINGWNGFVKRTSWEVAGDLSSSHAEILNALQKKTIVTPDEPGFISARIIAMIINEAFFAKEENISTENEIDIAMKLGTNYPHGPFEWADEIGIKNIYDLLFNLSKNDARYKPSALLEKKAIDQ
ncbi:MAG: 3-hydroxyacyl-CoA dehydrogenase family protein [Ferruginibacter sp.]